MSDGAPGSSTAFWSRESMLAALRAEGLTLRQIGARVGLSGERVRQLFAQSPPAPLYTAQEVAATLGCSVGAVLAAAPAAGVPRRQSGRFTFREGDLPALRAAMVRRCTVCGTDITSRARPAQLCRDPECLLQHRRAVRARVRAVAATPDDLLSDYVPDRVIEACRAVTEHGQFIEFGEARRLAGLTHMQLTWLRYRGIYSRRWETAHFPRRPPTVVRLPSAANVVLGRLI
jgi:hypothetical protein